MKKYLERIRFNNKGKYAIKIQKVFRGYRLRKKKREAFKKVKYDIDDLEGFDDFDDEWLKNEPHYETGL